MCGQPWANSLAVGSEPHSHSQAACPPALAAWMKSRKPYAPVRCLPTTEAAPSRLDIAVATEMPLAASQPSAQKKIGRLSG
jgi:hypothetical protein